MRWQQMILPIEDFRAREGDSYNIAMLKCAMEIVGTPFGTARPPQRRISETDRRQIEELLAPILRAEAELADETRRVGLASG
jgi:4-hydroxy-tetrahydrodipicolinate synthase